jgi:prevent-host-death family protein
MPKTISVTQARNDLLKLIDQADQDFTNYRITKNGKDAAVLMSSDEHDSLLETIEVLSDTSILNDIKAALKDVKAGNFKTIDEIIQEQDLDV